MFIFAGRLKRLVVMGRGMNCLRLHFLASHSHSISFVVCSMAFILRLYRNRLTLFEFSAVFSVRPSQNATCFTVCNYLIELNSHSSRDHRFITSKYVSFSGARYRHQPVTWLCTHFASFVSVADTFLWKFNDALVILRFIIIHIDRKTLFPWPKK